MFDYQESDVHRRYDLGRSLVPDSVRALMDLIRTYVIHDVQVVVDLGSGTGRFTAALAEAFGATVIGVEPATNMRAAAEAKPHSASVSFVMGSADRIHLGDATADMVFISQVLHHLPDQPRALQEVRRVLRPGGSLCIRQTTQENLDSYYYQRFFPQSRETDERRLPSRAALLNLAGLCQYRRIAAETIRHQIAATSSEYVEKIALRAFSDLEAIPDAAFQVGLAALRDHCATHPDFPTFAENDLFVFQRE